MPSEWQTVRIDELCQGIYDGPHATPAKTADGPIFLGISNLSNGRIDLSNAEHLSEEDFLTWTRRVTPQENDVVFSYETRLGEAARIPAGLKCCLGRRMALMRPHPNKVDSRFLLYAFLSPTFQEVIRTRTVHGSTVDRLALIEFPSFPVTIPSDVDEQRAIADILGSLDDKIELNRRMNATLEETARALFKSWFVDFDPVRAKMEGREPVGMDAETAALFPDRLIESELGPIPEGWDIVRLSKISKYIMSGGTPNTQKPEYWNGGIPWLSSGETRSRFIIDTEKTITQLGVQQSSTRSVRKFSTVIASAGQGHTRGQASLLMFESYINQSVVAIAANDQAMSDLYVFFDLSGRYEELRRISDSHSSRGSLTTKLLGDLLIIQPPSELTNNFGKFVKPLTEQIYHNMVQLRTLAETRDALLPKLLSGEVRIEGSP
jgi:type I restriction enzyme S subunit